MLKVEGVNLFYGAAQALRSVSLTAEIGRVTCVLGRNGVGKSSLLRAIVGHQPIRDGAITWNGADLRPLSAFKRARAGLGYVPQGREIFPLLTVRENLQTGLVTQPRRAREMDEEIFNLFPVLRDMLGRRGGDLSGGQQQQLAIARALLTKPKLLILDEPTEGIQPSIIRDIGRAILYLRQRGNLAILLVEQYFEWARDLADDYAVMDRGAVVLAGKRADMVETEVRKRLAVWRQARARRGAKCRPAMTDLMHSVAELIEERDPEGLEATLARVFFELSGARALDFWRVRRRGSGVFLQLAAALPDGRAEAADLPLAAAPETLRLAYQTRNVVRRRHRPDAPTLCALPVPGEGEVLGLIAAEMDGEVDRERLSVLGGLLRVYRSHLAALDYGHTDELTRLYNRRTFDDQFRRFALAEARRHGERRQGDVSGARAHLGVIDIDFFKQVNDRFGHPYGDEVLVLIADLMRGAFRDRDKLFRFGGEEFVVLMADCGADDALAAFERFRAAVEAKPFPQLDRVTVSIGVSSLRRDDTGSAAFGRADQALYVAKRTGRNRVLAFDAANMSSALETLRRPAAEIEVF